MDRPYDILLKALLNEFGLSLKTVVLFGSRARGDASPHSDHDIFLVIDGLPDPPMERTRVVRESLRHCLPDLPGPINLHAKTRKEFESDLTPLFLDVCIDGICLFGEEYFGPFRGKAMLALASSEMKRKRVGSSLFWMFPGGGARNWELTWEGYRELP
jgi:predicted nucleotidyltransferase